jgi:hypothetical protein
MSVNKNPLDPPLKRCTTWLAPGFEPDDRYGLAIQYPLELN